MKKKLDRKDKLCMDFKKELNELMEKHDFHNFLACLRIHKLAFIMAYNEKDKKFMKNFMKQSGEENCKFVDTKIPPFFSWDK